MNTNIIKITKKNRLNQNINSKSRKIKKINLSDLMKCIKTAEKHSNRTIAKKNKGNCLNFRINISGKLCFVLQASLWMNILMELLYYYFNDHHRSIGMHCVIRDRTKNIVQTIFIQKSISKHKMQIFQIVRVLFSRTNSPLVIEHFNLFSFIESQSFDKYLINVQFSKHISVI